MSLPLPIGHDVRVYPRSGDVIDANGYFYDHCQHCSNSIMPFEYTEQGWRCRVCHNLLAGQVSEISKAFAPTTDSAAVTFFQPDERQYKQELVGRVMETVPKITQAESRKTVHFFCSSCVRMRTSFRSKSGEVKCPKCKSVIDSKAITKE